MFFWRKKKLNVFNSKPVFEDVLSIILKVAGLTFSDIFENILKELGLPKVSIPLLNTVELNKIVAKTISSNIGDEKAYLALREIKKLLDEYRV